MTYAIRELADRDVAILEMAEPGLAKGLVLKPVFAVEKQQLRKIATIFMVSRQTTEVLKV